MSDNYTVYVRKMEELRVARETGRPLRGQLEQILEVVRDCEARWVLDDRLGRER